MLHRIQPNLISLPGLPAKTLSDTGPHHCFIVAGREPKRKRIAADADSTMVMEGKRLHTHEQLLPGKYIARVCDKERHSGCILQNSEEMMFKFRL